MENQIALSNVVFDLVGLFKSVITRRHHTGIGHFLDIVNLSSHQIMLSCSSDPFCWLEEMSCLSTDVHPCLHTWANREQRSVTSITHSFTGFSPTESNWKCLSCIRNPISSVSSLIRQEKKWLVISSWICTCQCHREQIHCRQRQGVVLGKLLAQQVLIKC